MKVDYQTFVNDLRQHQNFDKKEGMEAYMRHQFSFLGIQSVERRKLSHDFIYQFKPTDAIDWDIIEALWQEDEREFCYVALDLLRRQKRQLVFDDINHLKQLALSKSWWDTIDVIDLLCGDLSLRYPSEMKRVMLAWSEDDNQWLRRIAIDHQRLLRHKTDTALLATIIENNLGRDEFFINKAIGWSLREYSKTDAAFVQHFVATHSQLSPLSQREALKWLKQHSSKKPLES